MIRFVRRQLGERSAVAETDFNPQRCSAAEEIRQMHCIVRLSVDQQVALGLQRARLRSSDTTLASYERARRLIV